MRGFPKTVYWKTGCFVFDLTMGGGFKRGGLHEVLGSPDCGKTSLLSSVGAYLQEKIGAKFCFLETEGTLEADHLRNLGVDMGSKQFAFQQFPCFEDVQKALWGWVEESVSTKQPHFILIDTLYNILPKKYLKGVGDDDEKPGQKKGGGGGVALRARICCEFFGSGFLTKLARSNACLVVNNHLSASFTDSHARYPEIESPGGRKVKFYATRRILVTRDETIYTQHKGHKYMTAFKTRVKNIKGKILKPLEPYRFCDLVIRLEGGLQGTYSDVLYLSRLDRTKQGLVNLLGEKRKPMQWLKIMSPEIRRALRETIWESWVGSYYTENSQG